MATNDRFVVALDDFRKALTRLHEALAQDENEFIRDSVIQRFEFTFESAWKAMYRWLRARGNDVDEEAAVAIPAAFKLRLIENEKGWGQMRKYRNKTSHTYHEAIAIEVAAFVRQEAVPLFEQLLKVLGERAP